MPRVAAALLLLALGSSAHADRFWTSYNADVLPENDGWTRVFVPGAFRSVSGGVFALNSFAQPTVYDFNVRQSTAILDPGEEFALEWSARVDGYTHDTWVMIGRGAAYGGIGVSIGFHEVQVGETDFLPITPYQFHAYRLATSDMREFRFSIDGVESWTFTAETPYQSNINVLFGDWTSGSGSGVPSSHSEWDYVRFGVVPAPGAIVTALLGAAVRARRRRRG